MNLVQRALEKLAAIRGKRPELQAAGVAPEVIDAQLHAEAEQLGREMAESMTNDQVVEVIKADVNRLHPDGVQDDGSVIHNGQRFTAPTMTSEGMVVPPRTWNQ